MTTGISDLVSVSTVLSPPGASTADSGLTLLLTKAQSVVGGADVAPMLADYETNDIRQMAGHRIFSSASEVGEAYTASSEEYKVAASYYSQQPVPSDFIVGRWLHKGLPVFMIGNKPDTISNIKTAASTDSTLTVAGATTSTLDFSSATTNAAIALVIQTALRAVSTTAFTAAQAECVFKNGAYYIALPPSTATSSTPAAVPDLLTAGLVDNKTNNLRKALGFDGGFGASSYAGVDPEVNVVDSLVRITSVNNNWNILLLDQDITAEFASLDRVADWVEASPNLILLAYDVVKQLSANSAILTPNETSSLPARLFGKAQRGHAAFYTDQDERLAAAFAGQAAGINWEAAGSVKNFMFSTYAGIAPDTTLSTGGRAELERKKVNYYYGSSGAETLREAYTPGGWADNRLWLSWFKNALEVAVFNVLKTSPTRIPYTTNGLAVIRNAIARVCERGVANGGIAPGVLSLPVMQNVQQVTGNRGFDGTLTLGYLIWHPNVATVSQSDREMRKGPPFRIWVKSSGGINRLDLIMTWET